MSIPRQQTLFVGVDIHKDNHAICAVNCFTEVKLQREIQNSYVDFKGLVSEIKRLSQLEHLEPVFALEDTYGSGEALARFLVQAGIPVKSVNPVLVSRERQNETHPEKSDIVDALQVAKVSIQRIDMLPNYSITPSTEIAMDLRALSHDRDFLVKEQTRLKNQLHRLLHHSYGSGYRTICQKDIFGNKALKFWQKFPSLETLRRSRSPQKPTWLEGLDFEAIPQVSPSQSTQIQRKAKRLLALKQEMVEIEHDLQILLPKTSQHLETLSGCGSVSAARILAEIKDINRFTSPCKLAKYAGVSPRKFESGKTKRHKRSKSGNRILNKVLHQIALSQIGNQGNPHAKTYYAKKIKEGKSKKQALTCLKRQVIEIIYYMLKEQRPYYI